MQNSAGYGGMDADGMKTGAMDVDCKDSASKFGDSRFGQPVSDDEIFKLIKDQENVNTIRKTTRSGPLISLKNGRPTGGKIFQILS